MSTRPAAASVSAHPDGSLLQLRVQPRASRSAVESEQEGRWRVRLQAPPVDGAANDALIRLLADVLEIPRGRLSLERGDTGRLKTVKVLGLAPDVVRSRLAAAEAHGA